MACESKGFSRPGLTCRLPEPSETHDTRTDSRTAAGWTTIPEVRHGSGETGGYSGEQDVALGWKRRTLRRDAALEMEASLCISAARSHCPHACVCVCVCGTVCRLHDACVCVCVGRGLRLQSGGAMLSQAHSLHSLLGADPMEARLGRGGGGWGAGGRDPAAIREAMANAQSLHGHTSINTKREGGVSASLTTCALTADS